MADITNIPFRLIAKECGSELCTTEEVDAKALMIGSKRTIEMATFLTQEHPIAVQLLGHDPETLAQAAKWVEAQGADIVDLNMGCPVPKVVKKGQGAALMKDPLKCAQIFKSMRQALKIPLTIKIRSGWDEKTINAVEIARIAEAEGVDAIAVHPRTRSQKFTGKAPWQVIADVVQSVKIPVTGNGDVKSQDDARRMMKETGCQSVLIGRGALGQPWIFHSDYETWSDEEKKNFEWNIISRHRELTKKYFAGNVAATILKKHLVWYIKGAPNAASARHQIFTSKSADEAWEIFEQHWPAKWLTPTADFYSSSNVSASKI